MLQVYQPPSVQTEQGEPSLSELFAALVGFIRRQFSVILLVVLLTLGLAAGYVLMTPPLYTGQASLMIDASRAQVVPRSILGDDPTFRAATASAMVDSQIEILKSQSFAELIVNDLHLTQDPEFGEPARGPMAIARDAISGLFSFAESIVNDLHLTQDPEFGEPARGPMAIASDVISGLFRSSKEDAKSKIDPTQRAVSKLQARLTTSRAGTSYVIDIQVLSRNPDRAAQIANAVADAFIADQLKVKYETIRKATSWLQDRLNELLGQASVAERAVEDYKAKNNIVDAGGHPINEQQLSELNTALVKARADTAETKARLDRVSELVRAGEVDPATEGLATVVDMLHSDIISKLRLEYLDDAQHEAIYSKRYGSNHIAAVNLRSQMAEIRHSIFQELKQIAQATKSDYEIAKARENSLELNLAATVADSRTTNKAQIELHQLESAAKAYRALYESFQQRYTDSVQQQSLPITDARVVSRARPPTTKSSPRSFLTLTAATMGGLVLGFGLGALREMSDRGFRTKPQVEAKLNGECIALVPMIRLLEGRLAPVRTRAATENAVPRTISPRASLLRYVVDLPLSPFTELIRAIKVNIDRKAATESNNVIGITSSLPTEGKSTIAASLAQLIADGGARVILVDCDLRRPSLSRQLAPNATAGLIDVTKNTISLDEVIWLDPSTQLSFLPAGPGSRLIHTSELLASDAMKRLFAQLRQSYDYVIVDLSPVVPIVDVRSTTHLIDSFVFVIEWGKTKIDVVEHSLTSARGICENLVGVVLNKVNFKLLNRYEGHGNYYDHRYYALYGYRE